MNVVSSVRRPDLGRLSLLCYTLIVLCGCNRSVRQPAGSTNPIAPVVAASRATLANTLTVAGEFIPYQEVELHAKVAGYIRRINVDIGDRVKQGQVLAVLDVPELQAQVKGAQAGVRQSQSQGSNVLQALPVLIAAYDCKKESY
jgi:multidrug efflux pump subunit AcrA (membrane-fusion protein)